MAKLLAVSILMVCLVLCSAAPAVAGERLDPLPWPRLAPGFHLQDLSGEYHHLSDYRGKVLIVNFWASWCAPCRQELPSMNRAWAALKHEGVVMLAVNLSDDSDAIAEFTRDHPIDFPVLLDNRGVLARRWEVTGLPTTVVVSPGGDMVYQVVGTREWDDPDLLLQLRVLAGQGISPSLRYGEIVRPVHETAETRPAPEAAQTTKTQAQE